jgi:hypothetical protein
MSVMGILKTIRDALALPALAANGMNGWDHVPYESLWASPNHLVHVTPPDTPARMSRALAMSVPAVARARRLIVGSTSRCPLEARTGGTRADVQPIWMTRTDGIQSPTFRMTWTIDDLMFYGWSLWGLERDTDGKVIRADRIPAHLWDTDADGNVLVDGTVVDPTEVCLIPGPDEGLLTTAAAAIRHAVELQRLAQRAADTPAAQIDLHQTEGAPLNPDQIETLVGSWAKARRGQNGGIAYSSPTVDVRELGKADPGLLVEGRNAAALDIARACGVPAVMIDAAPAGVGNVTYRNQDARNTELVDYCLAPYMAAVAARLGQDDMVPRGWAVAFDLTDLTSLTVGDLEVPDDDRDTVVEDEERPVDPIHTNVRRLS